jgi:hypothetical protein
MFFIYYSLIIQSLIIFIQSVMYCWHDPCLYIIITNQQGLIIMTLLKARIAARQYSNYYNTSWHVRIMLDGTYQPYAHSDYVFTVASFYCGKEVK